MFKMIFLLAFCQLLNTISTAPLDDQLKNGMFVCNIKLTVDIKASILHLIQLVNLVVILKVIWF